ncbi:MAG TPA: hypothetical protein EYP30_09205 [Archaeoglobaceae archaeon]|nr:hypothetical protein [Archaeoglobaceae archaeon]
MDGIKDFAKVLRFTAPSETDEYFLKVRVMVSTSNGNVNVKGECWVSVQPVITRTGMTLLPTLQMFCIQGILFSLTLQRIRGVITSSCL